MLHVYASIRHGWKMRHTQRCRNRGNRARRAGGDQSSPEDKSKIRVVDTRGMLLTTRRGRTTFEFDHIHIIVGGLVCRNARRDDRSRHGRTRGSTNLYWSRRRDDLRPSPPARRSLGRRKSDPAVRHATPRHPMASALKGCGVEFCRLVSAPPGTDLVVPWTAVRHARYALLAGQSSCRSRSAQLLTPP